MKKYFSIGALLYSICISACAAVPQQAAEQASNSNQNCEDVTVLFNALVQPNIFKQTPIEFLKDKDAIWVVTKNEVGKPSFGTISHDVIVKGHRGNWLTDGALIYRVENNKTNFRYAEFNLNPSCFSKPENVFPGAAKYFGTPAETPSPDKKEWLRNSKDQDEWWIISIQSNRDGITLKAEITPAPTEESDE